jgi:hypothetical protein
MDESLDVQTKGSQDKNDFGRNQLDHQCNSAFSNGIRRVEVSRIGVVGPPQMEFACEMVRDVRPEGLYNNGTQSNKVDC